MKTLVGLGMLAALCATARGAAAQDPPPAGVETSSTAAATPAPAPAPAGETNTLVGAAAGGVPVNARPYYVRGSIAYRFIPVGLATKANDLDFTLSDTQAESVISYSIEGGYKLLPHLAVFARFGLLERFVAEEGESAFLVRDMAIGGKFSHQLALEGMNLSFTHSLSVSLPTSRTSQANDLYFAPELVSRVRVPVVAGLYAGADASFQYRFYRYAEMAGLQGGMNNQLSLGLGFALGYSLEIESIGTFDAGASVGTNWFKRYASREEFASPASDQVFWSQDWGWDVSLYYSPLQQIGFVVSVGQNAHWLRGGITGLGPTREDTEASLAIVAQY